MQTIPFSQLPALFGAVNEVFQEKKDELGEMDAKLGDGDLGLTMSKGYGALPEAMEAASEAAGGDVGKLLVKASMTMSSVAPSTMGFLMSSGLMEAGKALKGAREITPEGLAKFLTAFAAGIQKRGKCQPGERTILDAVQPGAERAREAAASGADLAGVIDAAKEGAAAGVEATKDMLPRYGKAAVHAAKAIGTADQGAVASYCLICGMRNYICKGK